MLLQHLMCTTIVLFSSATAAHSATRRLVSAADQTACVSILPGHYEFAAMPMTHCYPADEDRRTPDSIASASSSVTQSPINEDDTIQCHARFKAGISPEELATLPELQALQAQLGHMIMTAIEDKDLGCLDAAIAQADKNRILSYVLNNFYLILTPDIKSHQTPLNFVLNRMMQEPFAWQCIAIERLERNCAQLIAIMNRLIEAGANPDLQVEDAIIGRHKDETPIFVYTNTARTIATSQYFPVPSVRRLASSWKKPKP